LICSQIFAALVTISICLARADPGHGGGIGGGVGGGHGGGVGGHGAGVGFGGAHGGGGFGGFAAGPNGFGSHGGSSGIYVGRPYYRHVKRDAPVAGFGSEGHFLPWPVYRDYYDYY
jgi:hypothetical protein